MSRPSRRAGRRWRILAHYGERGNGQAFAVESLDMALEAAPFFQHHPYDRDETLDQPSVFDELVIDDWFHLEQMDDNSYWMRVGEYDINVWVKDGHAALVNVEEGA